MAIITAKYFCILFRGQGLRDVSISLTLFVGASGAAAAAARAASKEGRRNESKVRRSTRTALE
tara:strand:+ start:237 stop:425 length:189 start_codon:yes stop_codon:yes gene_type:complete